MHRCVLVANHCRVEPRGGEYEMHREERDVIEEEMRERDERGMEKFGIPWY